MTAVGWPTTPPASCCTQNPDDVKPIPPVPPQDSNPDDGVVDGSVPRHSVSSAFVGSFDPNEKLGLPGWGVAHRVLAGTMLAYTIFFENLPTASAPAQTVVITDQLDVALDWAGLRFTAVGFGGETAVSIAETAPFFDLRLTAADYRPEVGQVWWVAVNGRLDPQTGIVTWTFTTLDPATGDLPADALAGFLPPNDENGRGEGYVSFTIPMRPDTADGTVISNQAVIVFDDNAPIVTNAYVNEVGPMVIYLPLVRR